MKKTYSITLCGVFSALIFALTFVVAIPNGLGGYINLGDGIIILAGAFLGGPLGFIAAAVGSCLADIAASYMIFAPATFMIKGLMGLISGLVLYNKPKSLPKSLLTAVLCEILMIAGYFVYEIFVYGFGTAVAELMFNGIQGVAGIVFSVFLIFTAEKLNIFKRG